jgi:HAD superfamily hydrolase (TIGR01490 family)
MADGDSGSLSPGPSEPPKLAVIEAIQPGTGDLAVFDFDGTLLEGDTLFTLHRLARSPLARVGDWLALLPALLQWKLGAQRTAWFKERYLGKVLAPIPPRSRVQLLQHELPRTLIANLRPEALVALEQHRQQGHRLLILSASPRQLLQPVADQLGMELIATETTNLLSKSSADPLRLLSPNCKGAEKMRRLQACLGNGCEIHRLHAYGDSRGDRELLQAADHPHWRSFSSHDVPYPGPSRIPVLPILALGFLALLGWGLLQLPLQQRQELLIGLAKLPRWLPALYGVLGGAFLLRYWRWRLLLGAYGIGHWGWRDAIGWFKGFALTATPAKLGELARVHGLHHELGYPRLPLVQVFVIERLLDALAVALWLAWLAPAALTPLLGKVNAVGLALNSATASSRPLGLALMLSLALAALALGRLAPRLMHRLRRGIGAIRQAHWKRLGPAGIAAGGVSLLIWACEPLILWMLVRALAPSNPISVVMALATYLISGTAGMASTLPAGIGVNEGATVLLLGQHGIPVSTALTIAVLRRLLTPWSIVALAAALGVVQRRTGRMAPSGPAPWH